MALSPMLLAIAPSVDGSVERFSVGVIGMLIFLLGLAAFCPAIISFVVGWFWRSRARVPGFDGIEARLASDSLRRNPFRSGITIATMVISLAAIFTIAAFVNSLLLLLPVAWIVYEAIIRLRNPAPVMGPLMLAVAGGGR